MKSTRISRERSERRGEAEGRARDLIVLVAVLAAFACNPTTPSSTGATPCAVDSDCAWSCARRGDCCPSPCGCRIPMHEADKRAAEAHNREHCGSWTEEKCPTVGACGEPPPPEVLRCRAGACVSEKVPAAPSATPV